MTLDKAISKLDYFLLLPGKCPGGEGRDAIRLGIEALKAIKDYRADFEVHLYQPLPGETKN